MKGDISSEYQNYMIKVKESLRYDIKDDSCPASPLFTAKDISIQQVAMDTLGKEKEWVAVVNLNTQDKNSYLQSELPYCKARDYLIAEGINPETVIKTGSPMTEVLNANMKKILLFFVFR